MVIVKVSSDVLEKIAKTVELISSYHLVGFAA